MRGLPGMNRRSGKPARDPWTAKILFGVMLTALVVSEVALYSGVATIPESCPLGESKSEVESRRRVGTDGSQRGLRPHQIQPWGFGDRAGIATQAVVSQLLTTIES